MQLVMTDPLRDYSLLPCPYCAGEAELISYFGKKFSKSNSRAFVSCKKCRSNGRQSYGIDDETEHMAVMAWNRRDWQGSFHEQIKVHPDNVGA